MGQRADRFGGHGNGYGIFWRFLRSSCRSNSEDRCNSPARAKSGCLRWSRSLRYTYAVPTVDQSQSKAAAGGAGQACPNDDSGLKLPAGFCATVFADDIGHARHMVVAPSGVVYVNTWSGEYYGNDKPHAGGFLVALQDKAGTGKADVTERFGETVQSGGAGGTGIGLYKGSIYAEINDRIVRYALAAGSIVPKDAPRHHRLRIASWAAIIRCIRSSSMPKERCMWTWPALPIRAS